MYGLGVRLRIWGTLSCLLDGIQDAFVLRAIRADRKGIKELVCGGSPDIRLAVSQ